MVIRIYTDCLHTPPSLHHQDLKPRVNTASYKVTVIHWDPMGYCSKRVITTKSSLIMMELTRRLKELCWRDKFYFINTKSNRDSQSIINGGWPIHIHIYVYVFFKKKPLCLCQEKLYQEHKELMKITINNTTHLYICLRKLQCENHVCYLETCP